MRGMRVYCRVAPKSTSCGRFTTSAKSCRRIHYHHRLRNLISLREHPMKHMHSTSRKVSNPFTLPPPPSLIFRSHTVSNLWPERFLGRALSRLPDMFKCMRTA